VTATQVKIGESRAYHYSEDVRYAESLLDLVGNTPLVRLSKTTDGAKPLVLAKQGSFFINQEDLATAFPTAAGGPEMSITGITAAGLGGV